MGWQPDDAQARPGRLRADGDEHPRHGADREQHEERRHAVHVVGRRLPAGREGDLPHERPGDPDRQRPGAPSPGPRRLHALHRGFPGEPPPPPVAHIPAARTRDDGEAAAQPRQPHGRLHEAADRAAPPQRDLRRRPVQPSGVRQDRRLRSLARRPRRPVAGPRARRPRQQVPPAAAGVAGQRRVLLLPCRGGLHPRGPAVRRDHPPLRLPPL
mmetsp:Transcript_33020/g.78344  ORF Transcript_33020/g.78344 Transcript_33020/m.78344 type:complete len:213 (+) Transcript_33020:887-1525(+)